MSDSRSEKCPVDHQALPDASCPVPRNTRSIWTTSLPKHGLQRQSSESSLGSLSTDREISSIPKESQGNWVYPSEAQFFAAMARKNHNPQAADMKSIVPIHNAVNEHAWMDILKWEAGRGSDRCGGARLVTFKGRPNVMSPRARWRSLLGYSPPFDRHDWIVDRCGTRVRYIIDFYTGHGASSSSGNLSFYLDVRPALDNWEGVRMRVERFWDKWFGGRLDTSFSSS